MIRTNSPYEVCHELFAEYPLAAEAVDENGLVRSMVLLLAEGDQARFFVLVADQTHDSPSYSLFPWRGDGSMDIEPDGASVPDASAAVLTHGIPIPRDGSLFGWACGESVTTLISFRTRYIPAAPIPTWAVMPLANIPVTEWPPFAHDGLLGPWFWAFHQDRMIVSLDELIAGTSGLVFWVDTKDTLGSDCCVVAHDLSTVEGYTLRQGRYAYYEELLRGKPVPPLAELLANPDKTDLGPRFQ